MARLVWSQYSVIGMPSHQFHDEVTAGPLSVVPRIEHLGDVRMIHHRQRLPLRLEPGDDLLGVHPQLDDLERHPPPHRLGLLGHIDHAAAAFTDALQQFVAAERLATASSMSWILVSLDGRHLLG